MSEALTMEAFGIRLERRTTQLGLRACDVAIRSGIQTKRIQRLMLGALKGGPTLHEIEAFARVLSCSPAFLAFGVTK